MRSLTYIKKKLQQVYVYIFGQKHITKTYSHITVIYHSRDMNGWTSGAILRKKYPGCHLIGYDYGEPIPTIPKGTTWIIMVDVCMEPPQMRQLASIGKMGLTYIDHHQSSIDKIESDLQQNGRYLIGRVYDLHDEKLAACELTWKYCFPQTSIPIYIDLIGSADANRETKRYPIKTRELTLIGLENTHGFTSPESCPKWVLERDEDTISMSYAFQKKHYKELYEYADMYSFESQLLGYKALCLETTTFHPKAFVGVFSEQKHDIMVAFQQLPEFYRVSIYSLRTDISAAKIAKQFGGGGHDYAAGFQINDIESIL